MYLVQCRCLLDCSGATRLSNGVHAQLRSPNVHSPQTQVGRQHGSNGTATGTVITNHHLLTVSRK